MKLFSAGQIRAIDALTIQQEPISSRDLMERTAMACLRRLIKLVKLDEEVFVFCGRGNNGGDGLAIARLLIEQGFTCRALVVNYTDKLSVDAAHQYERFKTKYGSRLTELSAEEDLQQLEVPEGTVAIDALLGTGNNRPAEGLLGDAIDFINQRFKKIISVDVPSGLFVDSDSGNNKHIISSTLTLTFQFPKLAFLLPQNKMYVPEFEILNIGLSENAIALTGAASACFYVTKADISALLQPRSKFAHKGSFGHALLLAGSLGKSGAALISARAALRSGAGLLTLHSNAQTTDALLQQLPEAMTETDAEAHHISELLHPEKYEAIGFGPGVGTHGDTQTVLKKLLQYYSGKLVIDADGLNILSENKTWLSFLPHSTILTPHPKEFERLAGKTTDDFDRLNTLKTFSAKHRCIVILKGAHTAIAMPDGNLFFNSSGNAGLAKGGTGDGLTGIILGLLCRGYNPPQAALIGTYIHGFAADTCVKKRSMESLLITDVIDQLGKAFRQLESF